MKYSIYLSLFIIFLAEVSTKSLPAPPEEDLDSELDGEIHTGPQIKPMSSRHQAVSNKQRNVHNSKGPYIEDYDEDDCFEIGHFEHQEPPQYINPDDWIPSEDIDPGFSARKEIDPGYISAEPNWIVYDEEEAPGFEEKPANILSELYDEEDAHSSSKLHQESHSEVNDEEEAHISSKKHQETHSELHDEEEAHSSSKKHQETHSELHDEEEAYSSSKKHQETHSEVSAEEKAHSSSKKRQETHAKLYNEEEAHSSSKKRQETHAKLYNEEEARSSSKKRQETHAKLYNEEEARSSSKKRQEIHSASSVEEKSRLAKQTQSIASSKKDGATSTQQKPIPRSPQKPVVIPIKLNPKSTGKKN